MADDELYEEQARDWLESVDVPPPRLEVAQIIQIGHRQVRRRRQLAVGGTAAVLAAVAAIPATVPLLPAGGGGQSPASTPVPGTDAPLPVLACDVTELPLPDEYADPAAEVYPDVQVAAMDPTGRYIVGNGPYQRHAGGAIRDTDPNGLVLWEDGNPTALTPLYGGAMATGVNADGVVVGQGSQETGDSRRPYAWIYRDGDMAELPVPEGYAFAEASAINTPGDVVGLVYRNEDGRGRSVVVWPAGDLDRPRVLTGPASPASPMWITDHGLVVTQLMAEDGGVGWDDGAYLWAPDGTGQELPLPEGATNVAVRGVRGDWVVASATLPAAPVTEPPSPVPSPTSSPLTSPGVAIRWDLRDLTLRVLNAVNSYELSDVNAGGDLLYGESKVIRDGEPYLLPDPIAEEAITPPDTDYSQYLYSEAISDDGTVIAGWVDINTADHSTAAIHPVMWRC
jgi:hypothetical protein